MTQYRLALIGFGGVNRSLAELIRDRNEQFKAELGFGLTITAVSDLRLGSVVSANGIDPRALTETRFEDGGFAALSGGSVEAGTERIIRQAPADIVVEATFTDARDGGPAVAHCRWALEAGRHLVTVNKGPVAFAGAELKALAARRGLSLEYEGTVMSGTPVLRMARRTLAGSGLTGFEGILNGTSNYVLERLEAGAEFADALREAQAAGYAEADPTADIEGHDVRLKVAILANELLGTALRPQDIACTGITGLTGNTVRDALVAGKRWKLVGSARRGADGRVIAGVAPRCLGAGHPLAGIGGTLNAVSFQTDLLGPVTVSGPGAGRVETAYALLSDIIALHGERASRMGRAA